MSSCQLLIYLKNYIFSYFVILLTALFFWTKTPKFSCKQSGEYNRNGNRLVMLGFLQLFSVIIHHYYPIFMAANLLSNLIGRENWTYQKKRCISAIELSESTMPNFCTEIFWTLFLQTVVKFSIFFQQMKLHLWKWKMAKMMMDGRLLKNQGRKRTELFR